MDKLNKLDIRILNVVSTNARLPIRDIAEECNASRSAVNQRLNRLIAEGIVRDPGYIVDPKTMGYSTCTYVGIKLERGSLYKEVVPRLQQIDEIVECHYTTGPYNMLVKLYAIDNQDLMRILNGTIQEIPGVVGTETLISLDLSFERSISMKNVCSVEE